MNERILRLQALLRERGIDAAALMPGPNLYYFTGLRMEVTERPVLLFVPSRGTPFAWGPAFEAERLREAAGRVYTWGEVEGPLPSLLEALRREGLAGVGAAVPVVAVEYRVMRVLELELLRASAGAVNHVDAGPLCARLRSVKDAAEVERLEGAARLCDAGMAAAAEAIRPGASEAQVAAWVKAALERLGHAGDCHIMVASGPRSAVPHAGTSDRVMQDGELCWVDLVVYHEGYVGDITRTFPVGTVGAEARAIFDAVLQAQALGRAAARPGITGAQLDRLVRDHLEARGYGPCFTHRTGHGIGLEVHEEPYVVGSNDAPLEAGNVFTVEPGVYVPGLGGVRIEDDVLLVPGGARVLTRYPQNTFGGA